MRNRKRTLWANSVNLVGLYSKKPVRLTWHQESSAFYDNSGSYEVEANKIGHFVRVDGRVIGFASYNRKEVMLWTKGALAILRAMKNFINSV